MNSFLQQLENNEAILLMYLADELPPADKAEVELKLAGDAGMRATLGELRTAHAAYLGVMRSMDAMMVLPTSEAAAQRQAGRVMRQWTTDRLARPVTPAAPKGLRYPWWSYPMVSAAAVLFAFLVWWGHSDVAPQPPHDSLAAGFQMTTEPLQSPSIKLLPDDQKLALLEVFTPAADAATPEAQASDRLSEIDNALAGLHVADDDQQGMQ